MTKVWTTAAVVVAMLGLAASASAQSNFGTVALRSGFMPDPHVASGTSGGSQPASNMNGSCRGYITAQPDHIMQLSTAFSWLRIFAESSGDTTLVIQTPQGAILCNDDTYGTNPSIEQAFGPGTYRIWVGAYRAGENSRYQLKFTELRNVQPGSGGGGGGTVAPPAGGGGGAVAGLNIGARRGNFRPANLRTGFMPDPKRLHGTSGGSLEANGLGGACRGWIAGTPDHIMTLRTDFDFFRVYVASSSDTTLVIRTPSGQFLCNDDTYGTNPSIEDDSWDRGRYQIWVGSYRQGEMAPYDIHFTELSGNHP